MASLAARAASREPSQATIARRGGSTAVCCARDHQRRPAAVHERGLDQRRVVDAVRREVGLADDGQVGAAGVARQQLRQPVERAAGTQHRKGQPVPLGLGPGRGQHRLGLGLGMRQMLAQQLGGQMPAAHPGQERLGDQVERGDLRPAGRGQP